MCNKEVIGGRLGSRETYHQSSPYYTSRLCSTRDREQQAPTSLSITDRRENIQSKYYFNTLCFQLPHDARKVKRENFQIPK